MRALMTSSRSATSSSASDPIPLCGRRPCAMAPGLYATHAAAAPLPSAAPMAAISAGVVPTGLVESH